jgi:hypothetical protein
MKRYFIVPDASMVWTSPIGVWHSVDLGSHGPKGAGYHVVCLEGQMGAPPDGWVPMPNLADPKTPLKNKVDHLLLADVGITGEETMYEAAEKLGEKHHMLTP